MKLLKTIGICKETVYPYGKIENKNAISEQIYTDAKLNVIPIKVT